MKCIVKGCLNHQNEGHFIGALCSPCYEMLTTGEVKYGETFIHKLRDEYIVLRRLQERRAYIAKKLAAIHELSK